MADATHHFPRGFLWGTATAAHQVEGNNTNNDWWAWEHDDGKILGGHKSGLACDWWGGRWREDFDRAAQGGQNAHRLSVEWSRIEPSPAIWDEDALDHYRQIVKGLRERGLEPMVTLHHFTNPLWLTERAAWETGEAVTLFARFVKKVVRALGDYVDLWCTINEPNVFAYSSFASTTFPPGRNSNALAFRVMGHLVRAHAAAYHAIHAAQPQARVGLAQNVRLFDPARAAFPPDGWVANFQFNLFSAAVPDACLTGRVRLPGAAVAVPEARGALDFFGLNYYTRDLVAFDLWRPKEVFGRRFYPPDAELSDMGFNAHYPEGLYRAVRWARRYRAPIYVTENGTCDAADHLRPKFILEHLRQLWRTVNFNWPVRGYFHWTLVDNFEWERGWHQRFGLWELDLQTQARKPRRSAHLYAEICRENGLSSDMARRYAPEILETMFPG